MKINGTNSVGVAFETFADLDGGTAFSPGAAADSNANVKKTSVLPMPSTSRESVLNVDLAGSENTGLYFNHANTSANPFKVSKYILNSNGGTKNAMVFIKEGFVDLAEKAKDNKHVNKINITGGSGNTGIFTSAQGSTLNTAATINILNSNSSTGIYARKDKDSKVATDIIVNNTGSITAKGASVKGIIADKSALITSTGAITLNGTALSATGGSVGLAAMNGGKLTQSTGTSKITVDGSASIGVYATGSNSKLNISNATINTTNGAFNAYAKDNGKVTFVAGNTVNTGQKSLAFYTDDTGVIDFAGAITANIAGGSDSNSRGTAFLYRGTGGGYTPFNSGTIGAWATTRFNNMNNLTLNMAPGSRLFIAQNVAMHLSNTGGSGLSLALGANIVGTDYKTFMLYLSKLTLDQDINLDNPADAYNKLEISNSTIDNNNNNKITGTHAGQVAMAQKMQIILRERKLH